MNYIFFTCNTEFNIIHNMQQEFRTDTCFYSFFIDRLSPPKHITKPETSSLWNKLPDTAVDKRIASTILFTVFSQEKTVNKTEICILIYDFLGDNRWFPPFWRNLLSPSSGQKTLPDYMVSEFRNHNMNLHCHGNLTFLQVLTFSWYWLLWLQRSELRNDAVLNMDTNILEEHAANIFRVKDGMFLRNTGINLQDYTVSQPRWPQSVFFSW